METGSDNKMGWGEKGVESWQTFGEMQESCDQGRKQGEANEKPESHGKNWEGLLQAQTSRSAQTVTTKSFPTTLVFYK